MANNILNKRFKWFSTSSDSTPICIFSSDSLIIGFQIFKESFSEVYPNAYCIDDAGYRIFISRPDF